MSILKTFYFLNMISFEVGYFLVWYRVQNRPKKSDFALFGPLGPDLANLDPKRVFWRWFWVGARRVCIKDKLLEMVWSFLTI